MKLQILTATLLFSAISLYPSQQNQAPRTVAQILNDVGNNPTAIQNPHSLQQELIAADLADGREPLYDPRREILTLACILTTVQQD